MRLQIYKNSAEEVMADSKYTQLHDLLKYKINSN